MPCFEHVACIVRTVGERTTANCISILRAFFGTASHVNTVCRQPFQEALRESFRLGIELGKPWTLMIDADVLCSPKGLESMLGFADALPENAFMLNGSVTDRFFCRYRRAGNRLYRTSMLPAALELIPATGTSLRPERDMCEAMLSEGAQNFQTCQIIGLHDYEQFHVDILRKSALFALKHGAWRGRLVELWNSNPEDIDFRCALEGMRATLQAEKVDISTGMISMLPGELVAKWLRMEKAPLGEKAYSGSDIDSMVVSELKKEGITPTRNISPRICGPCAA